MRDIFSHALGRRTEKCIIHEGGIFWTGNQVVCLELKWIFCDTYPITFRTHFACVYIYIYIYVCVCVGVCVCVCVDISCHIYYLSLSLYIYIYIYVCVCVCVCVYGKKCYVQITELFKYCSVWDWTPVSRITKQMDWYLQNIYKANMYVFIYFLLIEIK